MIPAAYTEIQMSTIGWGGMYVICARYDILRGRQSITWGKRITPVKYCFPLMLCLHHTKLISKRSCHHILIICGLLVACGQCLYVGV